MNTYAVFLRGVNVTGNNPVDMDVLKKALARRGFDHVKTYINSGNIILRHNGGREEVNRIVAETLKSQFKISVEMIVKSPKEIEAIISNDPFDEKENDNSKKIVVLLSEKAGKNDMAQFRNDERIEEKYYHRDDVIFIYYHNGVGRSKFAVAYIEKRLKTVATARNWNTLLKMSSMLKEE